MVTYEWRGGFDDAALNALHSAGFGEPSDDDWWSRVNAHSLGWVCAYEAGRLVGFVNVAWDGGFHAFLLDTVVAEPGRGIGTRLVALAADNARDAGCHWLHVDFEDELRPFYLDACGFRATSAGLLALRLSAAASAAAVTAARASVTTGTTVTGADETARGDTTASPGRSLHPTDSSQREDHTEHDDA